MRIFFYYFDYSSEGQWNAIKHCQHRLSIIHHLHILTSAKYWSRNFGLLELAASTYCDIFSRIFTPWVTSHLQCEFKMKTNGEMTEIQISWCCWFLHFSFDDALFSTFDSKFEKISQFRLILRIQTLHTMWMWKQI